MALLNYFLLNLLLVSSLSAMDSAKNKEQVLAEVKALANHANLAIISFGFDNQKIDKKISNIVKNYGKEYTLEIAAILDGFFLTNHLPKSAKCTLLYSSPSANQVVEHSYSRLLLDDEDSIKSTNNSMSKTL